MWRSIHLAVSVSALKRRLRNIGIRWGLLRNPRICLGGKSVVFPDSKRSDLLLRIALYGDESYEGELVQLLRNYPWPVGVFFSVGANVGLYSTIAELTLSEDRQTLYRRWSLRIEHFGKITSFPSDRKRKCFQLRPECADNNTCQLRRT